MYSENEISSVARVNIVYKGWKFLVLEIADADYQELRSEDDDLHETRQMASSGVECGNGRETRLQSSRRNG